MAAEPFLNAPAGEAAACFYDEKIAAREGKRV